MKKEKSCILKDDQRCFGCMSCVLKCPAQAISVYTDAEGFLRPVIDDEKCIKCGLCQTVCPIFHYQNCLNPKTEEQYICWANDREKSSSGGLFPVLAKFILQEKGYVCAATMKNGRLKHFVTNNPIDLEGMRKSKYFQSDTGCVFSEIELILKRGSLVLFVGTPCQIAGLKLFLKKPYSNLITADIICHGVPPPGLFQKYVDALLGQGTCVEAVSFRDKSLGWHQMSLKIQTNHGLYQCPASDDAFFRSFLCNMILRPSCYSCPFARYERVSDITLADAWCVRYFCPEWDDDKGMSLILLNTNRGKELFQKIRTALPFCRRISETWAKMGQTGLTEPVKAHMNRNAFFHDAIHHKDILNVFKNYMDTSRYIGLLNFHFENVNYGAVLTSFALNRLLNQKGYFAFNIDYIPEWMPKEKCNKNFELFRKRYLPRTYQCRTISDLYTLNSLFDTFIVGSDQVFRYRFTWKDDGAYFLKFVEDKKRKISYAASFGVPFWEGEALEKEIVNYWLHRFTALSVREDSGVSLIKEISGLTAEQVLDPVFLIHPNEYISLMENTEPSNKIVSYVISANIHESINNLIPGIENIFDDRSIEKWLESIYRSKYVVTDSFHGVCFALIFKKPVSVVVSDHLIAERIASLFRTFEMDERQILIYKKDLSLSDIQDHIIQNTINEDLLEKLRQKSLEWLLKSIQTPVRDLKEDAWFIAFEKQKKKNKKMYKWRALLYKIAYHFCWGRNRKRMKNAFIQARQYRRFLSRRSI